MHITQLKIRTHGFKDSKWKKIAHYLRGHFLPAVDVNDQNNYLANAVSHDGKYFYQVNGLTIEIDREEYEQVLTHPRLYYFSSALKLHFRIFKAKELGLGYNWPESSAAPLRIFELEKKNDQS